MSRAYSRNDIEIDRYDDRRSHVSRDGGRSRYDDRFEEEIDYRRGSGPLPSRRESVIIKEREEVTRTPAFLREDYGRTTAGPVVLRAREREDFEFAPRPRRRSPSPEVKKEREEIIIRRDQREERPEPPPPRPREVSREREEIIIRRDERSRSRGPARFRDEDTQREEIIIRRDERESTAPPRRAPTRDFSEDREEIIIRREEKEGRARFQDDDTRSMRSYRPPPSRAANTEREEIIIRREEREREDDSRSRVSNRYHEDDLALTRPISRERARGRSDSSESRDEIIIRRDERQGRGGNQERQEIIIRRSSRSRSRSPSPAASVRTAPMPAPAPAPEPQIVYAPQIHQEVITHHRHIDHGYEVQLPPHRPREPYREPVIARAPSPPSPPPPPAPEPVREREEERIEISRTNTRNGRSEREDIIIDRTEGARSVPPPARDRYEEREITRERSRGGWEERNIQEEAEYYNERANARGHIGEAYRGATKDWELVDVPPGTRRVRMDGVGGGQQEITWQRYNGARRAKFHPDGEGDEGYSSDYGRPAPRPIEEPAPSPQGTIGPRWAKQRDPTDGLWTEVTKDLVVKEAIIQMGYEYDETDEYYYVFKHLRYADMARLVGLSEEIRKERHKRIKEIQWENAVAPRPAIEPTPPRLAIEGPPSRDRGGWDRDEERYVEREIVYRGGRPPPPVGWRR